MTVVDQKRAPQPDSHTDRATRDRAREQANRTNRIAEIAERQLAESEHERSGRTRYEDGLQVLSWLVAAPWDERTVDVDRVLHDDHGSLDVEKVREFIDLLLSGRSSLEARHAMLRRPAVLADEVRRAAAEAREVAAFHHRFADGPEQREHVREAQPATRPALPAGSVPPPRSNGELPRRQPIAPAQPPLYPPAPPELPAEQTGQMVTRHLDAMRATGMDVTASEAASVRLRLTEPPSVGPVPDAQFSPTALPGRIGDTVTMRTDEVLAQLAADSADVDDSVAPPPFPEASTGSLPAAASRRDGGDDAES